MGRNTDILEPKRMNKTRIVEFISSKGSTSKAEIASQLKLSMPTTLQNVKELVEAGIVVEDGEYESTGGRKAKALSIARDAGYAAGVDITNNHICLVLVNTRKEIICSERQRLPFQNIPEYYEGIGRRLADFIGRTGIERKKVIGAGISLPGIVDKEQKLLLRSHTLQVENVGFRNMEHDIGFDYMIENDANSAAYAELSEHGSNAVYLSLSNTVGGAIYLGGHLYEGEHFKSAEFGHMIIERNGRPCYCGKMGCLDAYCASKILSGHTDGSLEAFFAKIEKKDARLLEVWEEYLDALAVAVTNLRMAFDCDIVLGGYLGGYLQTYMPELARKVKQYNKFDIDTSYLRTGKYKFEASAYGVTLKFITSYLKELNF